MNTIIDKIDLWTTAQELKTSNRGRSASNQSLLGIKKLRELILELAVQGKLVPQDPKDEPASELLKKIEAEKKWLIKEGKIKKQEVLPEVGEDEKPFDLPKGWEWTRIRSVGHDWGQKTPDADFSYIEVSAIDNTKGEAKSPSILTASEAPSRARKIVKLGTVIYSTVRPYLKNICVIEQEYSPEPIASTAFAILHPYLKMPGRFFLFYLQSPVFVRYVESEQIGIAYPAINDKQFFSGVIPLPPLAEQHRIVAKVDELMALCDELENQQTNSNAAHETLVATLLGSLTDAGNSNSFEESWQRIANYFDILFTTEHSIDQLKQTILQLAVMGKLTQQNPNDEPASELLKKIAKEKAKLVKERKIKKKTQYPKTELSVKYFEIPKGWKSIRLNELGYFSGGGTPSKSKSFYWDGNIPWVSPKDMYSDFITDSELKITEEGVVNSTANLVPVGSLLIVARSGILKRKLPVSINMVECTVNQDIKVIVPYIPELNVFIQLLLRGHQNFILEELVKQGMTVQSLEYEKFENQPFPLPPLAEQQRIVSKVDELFALCDGLMKRLVEAQTLQNQMAVTVVEQALSTQAKGNGCYTINEQISVAAEP